MQSDQNKLPNYSQLSDSLMKAILSFWFVQHQNQHWFGMLSAEEKLSFDQKVKEAMSQAYTQALSGNLLHWCKTGLGCVALCLLFDQYPRNCFRHQPQAFITDELARDIALLAVQSGFDLDLSVNERLFLYLPFEHSESLADQGRSVALMSKLNDPGLLDYAIRHLVIVERFGRFPHRNQSLGRQSSEEEFEFLKQPNSSF